jgi:hypothetical protein
VGKLTPAQGNYTFTIVAVEYFTKWVEAKPVMNKTSATIQKLFWQNISSHYGVKMGRDICGHRKDKTRGLSPHGSPRSKAGAFMERRQSLSVLHLSNVL